jgi:hypothetical protein
MNVVALPVDSGYATLGHLIEREHAVEAIRTDWDVTRAIRHRRLGYSLRRHELHRG